MRVELVHEPDRDAAVNKFDDLLMQHIGFAVSNTASTLLLGLSFVMGRVPGTAVTQPHFRALNRIAAAFAMLADLSMMLLGGELKRRERLSARLGDLSHLYLGCAQAVPRPRPPGRTEPAAALGAGGLPEKAESALQEVLASTQPHSRAPAACPGVPLRCTAQGAVRRAGCRSRRSARPPRGRSGAGVSSTACIARDPEQPLGALKHAFDALAASQGAAKAGQGDERRHAAALPGEHPIDAALTAGALDPAEAEQLRMAELARRKVIDVDDFARKS